MVHIPRKYTGLEGQTQSQQPRLWGAHRCSATRLPHGFESQSSSSVFQEMKGYCTDHHALTTVLIYTKLPLAKLPLHLCKGELLCTWGPDPSRGTTLPCSPSFQRCPSRARGFLGAPCSKTPSSKGLTWEIQNRQAPQRCQRTQDGEHLCSAVCCPPERNTALSGSAQRVQGQRRGGQASRKRPPALKSGFSNWQGWERGEL